MQSLLAFLLAGLLCGYTVRAGFLPDNPNPSGGPTDNLGTNPDDPDNPDYELCSSLPPFVASTSCLLPYQTQLTYERHPCITNIAFGASYKNLCGSSCFGYFEKQGQVVGDNQCCPQDKLIPLNNCGLSCSNFVCPGFPDFQCVIERCNRGDGKCRRKFYSKGNKLEVTMYCYKVQQ